SFGYKLARPLTMQLDLGAAYTPSVNTGAFGAASYNPGFNGLFVKNFSLDWRPGSNSLVRFSYQDVRSPLQWGPYGAPGYGYSPSPFGYTDLPGHPSRHSLRLVVAAGGPPPRATRARPGGPRSFCHRGTSRSRWHGAALGSTGARWGVCHRARHSIQRSASRRASDSAHLGD